MWTVLRDAHGDGDQKSAAQALLVECYGPAVRRYLFALTKDEHVTDDLWQRFMVQLLDGGFRNAKPHQGRFRSYVKVSLFHLVAKEHRNRSKRPVQASDFDHVGETQPADANFDTLSFDSHWREQLIGRAWAALRDAQPRYHHVLRARVDHPDASTANLVAILDSSADTTENATQWNPALVRKLISRARERYAGLLLDEVARSVEPPTLEQVESELIELRLLEYCRPALEARAREEA